jgi:hypothetical protein
VFELTNVLLDFLLDPQFGGAILIFLLTLVLFHWCFIWRRTRRGLPAIKDYQWKSFDYIWYTLGFFSAIMLVANITFSQLNVTKKIYESNVAAIRSSVQDALYEPIQECIDKGVPIVDEVSEQAEKDDPEPEEILTSVERLDLHFHLKYSQKYEVRGTRHCKDIGKIWNNVIDGKTVDKETIALGAKEFTDDDHAGLISNWNHWIGGYREVSKSILRYEGLKTIYSNWSLIFAVAVALRITKSSGERRIAILRQANKNKSA